MLFSTGYHSKMIDNQKPGYHPMIQIPANLHGGDMDQIFIRDIAKLEKNVKNKDLTPFCPSFQLEPQAVSKP